MINHLAHETDFGLEFGDLWPSWIEMLASATKNKLEGTSHFFLLKLNHINVFAKF